MRIMSVAHRMTRPLPVAAAILAVGAALHALLWSRQGITVDEFDFLLSGVEFLETRELPPVSKETAQGGHVMGALLSLLVAAPLAIWPDYRAPGLLVGLSHLAAVAVLSICIGRALGARFLAAWLAVYWLSPWRLALGGIASEPAAVFLPAALHLASAYRLREEPHPGWSLLHAATLTAAMQINGACFMLVVLTAVLAARRHLHLHLRGALLGALLGGLTLLPTAQALIAGDLPRVLPDRSDLPWGLIGLLNLTKGAAYWFRAGSPHVEEFLEETASTPSPPFVDGLTSVVLVATTASAVLALFASWRYFRRPRPLGPDASDRRGSPADGPLGHAGWCFAVLCTVVSLSPAPARAGWEAMVEVEAAGGRPFGAVIAAVAVAAVLATLASRLRFRRRPSSSPDRPDRPGSPADWMRAYAGWCLVALCAAAAVSGVPLRHWHMAPAVHAACLPVAAWMHAAFRSSSVLPRAAAATFILLEVVVVLLVAFGNARYQLGSSPVLSSERPDAVRVRALVPDDSR